jgi:hypothetical protein
MIPSRFVRPALAALVSSVAFAGAQAQQGMSPGLWETTTTMKNAAMSDAMAKMQEKMAAMTPEQRAMVQQMMASRGVGMGGGGNAITAKNCVAKDQAARGGVPQTDGRCQNTEVSRSGSTVKYSFACTGDHPMTGTGEFTMDSPTAYTMHSVSDTMVDGKPQHMEMDIAGKWVGADCGSVKPFAASH